MSGYGGQHKEGRLGSYGFSSPRLGTRVPGLEPGRIVGRDACLVSRLGGVSPPQGCVRHLFATHANTTISGMRFFARPCNDLPTCKQSRRIRQVDFKVSYGSYYPYGPVGISGTGAYRPRARVDLQSGEEVGTSRQDGNTDEAEEETVTANLPAETPRLSSTGIDSDLSY